MLESVLVFGEIQMDILSHLSIKHSILPMGTSMPSKVGEHDVKSHLSDLLSCAQICAFVVFCVMFADRLTGPTVSRRPHNLSYSSQCQLHNLRGPHLWTAVLHKAFKLIATQMLHFHLCQ